MGFHHHGMTLDSEWRNNEQNIEFFFINDVHIRENCIAVLTLKLSKTLKSLLYEIDVTWLNHMIYNVCLQLYVRMRVFLEFR